MNIVRIKNKIRHTTGTSNSIMYIFTIPSVSSTRLGIVLICVKQYSIFILILYSFYTYVYYIRTRRAQELWETRLNTPLMCGTSQSLNEKHFEKSSSWILRSVSWNFIEFFRFISHKGPGSFFTIIIIYNSITCTY